MFHVKPDGRRRPVDRRARCAAGPPARRRGPAVGSCARRLADDQPPTGAEDRRGGAQGGRRLPEAPGHHGVDWIEERRQRATRRPSSPARGRRARADRPTVADGRCAPCGGRRAPVADRSAARRSRGRGPRRRCRDRRRVPPTPSSASTNAPACSTTSSTGRAPSIPRRCEAARASSSARSAHGAGSDHHAAVRLLALRPARHAVDLGQRVVQHLAVGRGHGIE